ncbi:regulation of protein catabolic process [Trichomonas vaginalis G3]|uniref:regulation of protein catabolic process n=1 Tax=Trichomonas vaginalis (strain ATCC PRA-98 / G3) TaxID=412133 RepID=UPI0021E53832|nr:regulation of protein catabolic process [Trichomonas vaginalis G3]KAI5542350.1 regulation of protein catabolic process [Trichomonas vaginalis G3]
MLEERLSLHWICFVSSSKGSSLNDQLSWRELPRTHVRAGAALAIGISCAGTGNSEAIEVLKPLLNDNEDAVTQNAMIAMAWS